MPDRDFERLGEPLRARSGDNMPANVEHTRKTRMHARLGTVRLKGTIQKGGCRQARCSPQNVPQKHGRDVLENSQDIKINRVA